MKIIEILLMLIILIMTLQKGRIRLLFQILFSLYIGAFIYGKINNKYEIWTWDKYSLTEMNYFITISIENYFSIWAVLLAGLFMFIFYIILKAIARNVFSEKGKENIYNKRSDLILNKFIIGHKCVENVINFIGLDIKYKEYNSNELINKKINDLLLFINLFMVMIVLDILTVFSIILCSILLVLIFFMRPIIEIIYKKTGQG